MSVLRIKNTPLRRAALIVGFPLAALYVAPVSFLLMPFRVVWNMARAALSGAMEEWGETWRSYPVRLLRTGFWWGWDAKYHADPDAALERAKERVHS